MGKYALIVEFVCLPGNRKAVVDRALQHGQLVIEEPGCLNFEVLLSTEDERVAYLYEVYKNYDAWKEHDEMDYMPGFREDIDQLVEKKKRVICTYAQEGADVA